MYEPLYTADEMRAAEAGHEGRIPAVALTAYARVEDRIRALNAGFQVHVAKPVDPKEFLALIVELCGAANE